MMSPEYVEHAAELLLGSRRNGAPLQDLPPELVPMTIGEAYAVQDATLRQIGPMGGWKIGAKPDSEPRCSVIPAAVYHASGVALEVPPQGFNIEVETAFVFSSDLPDRGHPYSEADVAEAIGAVALAVELCASRFVDRKSLPSLTPIADQQSNAGVILGAPRQDWQALDFVELALSLRIGDAPVNTPSRNMGLAETLPLLVWLANHALTRGHPISAGHAVITGARLGPIALGGATDITVECDALPEVRATFHHTAV